MTNLVQVPKGETFAKVPLEIDVAKRTIKYTKTFKPSEAAETRYVATGTMVLAGVTEQELLEAAFRSYWIDYQAVIRRTMLSKDATVRAQIAKDGFFNINVRTQILDAARKSREVVTPEVAIARNVDAMAPDEAEKLLLAQLSALRAKRASQAKPATVTAVTPATPAKHAGKK